MYLRMLIHRTGKCANFANRNFMILDRNHRMIKLTIGVVSLCDLTSNKRKLDIL